MKGFGMDQKKRRWIAACALIAYGALLIRLVVFKAIPVLQIGHIRLKFNHRHTGPSNLILFKTIWPSLSGGENHLITMVNLVGNIVPFMPVGFLALVIYPRMTWQKSLALAIAVGLAMEVMELVFRVGIFDVDDIILNAFGVMLGYGLFAIFNRRAQTHLQSS
jgi:glycopeptide antibiotics resistance protein